MSRLLALISVALVATLAGCAASSSPTEAGPERDTGGERDSGGRPVGDSGSSENDATGQNDAGADTTDDAGDDTSAPDDAEADTAVDDADDAAPEVTPDVADEPDVPAAPPGGVAGRVWAPGNAPGMVPAGQEIPISGAVVYLTPTRPDPIPQHAYCEECTAVPARTVETDAQGRFRIDNGPVGEQWLVIQKGQFRIERQVNIVSGEVELLTDAETTFPASHNPDAGDWIPRIALASGSYDHLEDIFGKIGMGAVDSSGAYRPETAAGYFDVWTNGGRTFTGAERGSLTDLVNNLDNMLQYHIIFIPCSGDSNTGALNSALALQNIRDYIEAGGNLYVTDWSGEWHDNVFPAFLTYDGFGVDTPANAWDAAAERWSIARFGSADGSSYDSPDAEAVDRALFDWLNGQQGPTAESTSVSTFNAGEFYVEGNWNWISATSRVQIGTDRDGEPIYNEPRVYVIGSQNSPFGSSGKRPLTVTYEPVGCGRVLYSTYHTTDSTHVGLVPQERVLLYLIMEIGTCRDPKQ